jgi:hypothetical protein
MAYMRAFFFSLYLIIALPLAFKNAESVFVDPHGGSPFRKIGDTSQS